MVGSMMCDSELPKSFWGYALEMTIYVVNKGQNKLVDKTPYEMWYNKKPVHAHIKIWSCPAYVQRMQSEKLGVKSNKCLFV